jgi:hypothetical protein
VTEREKLGTKLNPVLKEWIDSVIVPGLVRTYLVLQRENSSLKLKAVPNSTMPKLSHEVSQ